MRFKIEVETEWKPNPDQTEIEGTEIKPKRSSREVAATENLNAAYGLVTKTLVDQYDKGALIFIYAKVEGNKIEYFRAEANGIKEPPKNIHKKITEHLKKNAGKIGEELTKKTGIKTTLTVVDK